MKTMKSILKRTLVNIQYQMNLNTTNNNEARIPIFLKT